MTKKNKKRVNLKINNILILLAVISSVFLIYNILLLGPIEAMIRYIIIGVIILINIFFFTIKKKKSRKASTVMMIIFILLNCVISFSINKVYGIIDSINKNKIVYSSSLVTLKSNKKINSIDDVTKYKIGIVDDSLSIDNYIIPKEIIDENKLENDNELVVYDDILVMLHDLYNKKIDLMFVSSNYSAMFKNTEGFENIDLEIKVIMEKDKTIKKNNLTSSFTNGSSSTKKPFSILLMGVDSEKDGLKKNAYANGDGLILLTFNPETLNVTMMSIPRDSYVPISCRNNTKNKLTHAGWFGIDCMIETIGNVFDVDIDYYVKVNFKGLVGIVDAVGGVSVDVPKKLCTDDSNRQGKICINKGIQTLNGEQALVLARNRYDLALGDIDRGYNQQLLLRGMMQKLTTINNVNTVLEVLETVSNNLDTNLTTNEILSFYNILKDVLAAKKYQNNDFLNIIQIKVGGTNKKIYFKSTKSELWCYLLDNDDIKSASKEMKTNLEVIDADMEKTFELTP